MQKPKHTFRKLLVTLLLATCLLSVMGAVAHAQDAVPLPDASTDTGAAPTPTPPATTATTPSGNIGETQFSALMGSNNDIVVNFAKLLAILLRLISQILFPILMFAGGLMKNDFLYTGAVDLKLSEMWVQVRNLVNIAYVLMLLAVALYNVIGLGELVSMLELKKALPKIILGLVLVNFSYAGVKVVLDVANVATTFAFSIGRTDARLTNQTALQIGAAQGKICNVLGADQLANAFEKSKEVLSDVQKKRDTEIAACSSQKDPAQCQNQLKKVYATQDKPPKTAENNGGLCVKDASGKLGFAPEVSRYLTNWNIDGSLMTIAIKFMNIQKLSEVASTVSSANGGIAALTINMLFSIIMYLIYAVSFIVLLIILFTRAATLWMIIIFSPLLVLNVTFPNLIPGGAGGFAGKITKSIIAPIIIGFVLSIGYILLSTMQNVNYEGLGGVLINAPTSSIDNFQDLLIAVGSIVFVWLGIKAANDGTISESVANTVLDGAQSTGTWLAKAPFLYTPIFQIKSPHSVHHGTEEAGKMNEMLNLDTISQIPGIMKQNKESENSQAARDFVNFKGSLEIKDIENLKQLATLTKEKTADVLVKDHQKELKAWAESDIVKGKNDLIPLIQAIKKGNSEEQIKLLKENEAKFADDTAAAQPATIAKDLGDIANKFDAEKPKQEERSKKMAAIIIEQNNNLTGTSKEKGEEIAKNFHDNSGAWNEKKKLNLINAIEFEKTKEVMMKEGMSEDDATALLREIEAALRKK